MLAGHLRSVDYEPAGEPSLYDLWEAGIETKTSAPLAVLDPHYGSWIVAILGRYRQVGSRVVSIGAGNGHVESQLRASGWNVLATDTAASALRVCRSKGLSTATFRLLDAAPLGEFDVIYCDGVMGHLWEPARRSAHIWVALAELGHEGAICLVSNDLSDGDQRASFSVHGAPAASFYRPPAGWYVLDAASTGRWSIEMHQQYAYARRGRPRRREIVLARLLPGAGRRPRSRHYGTRY